MALNRRRSRRSRLGSVQINNRLQSIAAKAQNNVYLHISKHLVNTLGAAIIIIITLTKVLLYPQNVTRREELLPSATSILKRAARGQPFKGLPGDMHHPGVNFQACLAANQAQVIRPLCLLMAQSDIKINKLLHHRRVEVKIHPCCPDGQLQPGQENPWYPSRVGLPAGGVRTLSPGGCKTARAKHEEFIRRY